MKEDIKILLAIIFMISMTAGIFTYIGYIGGKESMQKKAVKMGYAEYNRTNAAWQWRAK